MAYIEFSFDNSLYVFLFALSSIGQMKLIELTENIPQMILIFLDSFSLLFMVLIEDISIAIIEVNSKLKIYSERNAIYYKLSISFIEEKDEAEEKKYKILFYIIVLSLLTTLISSLNYMLFVMIFAGYSGSYFVFNLLFTWLFLRVWSNANIHRHHFFALILLSIGLMLEIRLNLDEFPLFFVLFDNEYWKLCLALIGIILFISTRESIEKYTLDILYIKHFRLLFYEGIGSLFFSCIIFGVLQYAQCDPDNYSPLNKFCLNSQFSAFKEGLVLCFNYSTSKTFYVWFYVFATALMNALRVLINKNQGPTHRYSGDIISFAIFVLIDIIKQYVKKDRQIFNWKGFNTMIMLTIGCLIYNENIRIKVFNMAINTIHEIKQRAQLDPIIGTNDLIQSLQNNKSNSNYDSFGDLSFTKSMIGCDVPS